MGYRISIINHNPENDFGHSVKTKSDDIILNSKYYRPGSMGGYFTYDEIGAEFERMKQLFPDLISEDTIGYSINNLPIKSYRFGSSSDGSLPNVLFTALHHAREHGLRRIVLVMPFLNIIEQTAKIYSVLFSETAGFHPHSIIEHHSLAGDPGDTGQGDGTGEKSHARLLAENWDAPIILTTSVQCLESLMAYRPSRCRKLHRLAKSVILFDEVQTLPPRLAKATLATLLFAAATATFLAWRHPDNRLNLALLAVGLTIYAGREHDLHRLEFLAENFTKWQFYTMAAVPLWQKICFGTAMVLIVGTIGLFAVRMVQQTIDDLKRGESWTLLGVIWLTTLIASQIADHSWLNETYFGRALEETAELMAAAFAVLVVWHFPRQPAKPSSSSRAIPGDIPSETARANVS